MSHLNEIISKDISSNKKSRVFTKGVLFFLLMEGQQTHSIGFSIKDGVNLPAIRTQCWKYSVCLLFTFRPGSTGESCKLTDDFLFVCLFSSAAVMVIFKCILRSRIPQGRSFPRLAQSWSLCCCPFDFGRKIPCLMYSFDFILIKMAVWELITPLPIHPAEVQGYFWNNSTPWCVKTEEKPLLLFT